MTVPPAGARLFGGVCAGVSSSCEIPIRQAGGRKVVGSNPTAQTSQITLRSSGFGRERHQEGRVVVPAVVPSYETLLAWSSLHKLDLSSREVSYSPIDPRQCGERCGLVSRSFSPTPTREPPAYRRLSADGSSRSHPCARDPQRRPPRRRERDRSGPSRLRRRSASRPATRRRSRDG